MNSQNYFPNGPRIQLCKCGCNREVKVTPWQPRLEYYSDACRSRLQRERDREKYYAKKGTKR